MCVKIGYFFALKSVKNRLLIYFLNTLVNLFPKQEEVDNDPIGAGANENEVTSLLNSNRYGRTDFICRVRFAPKRRTERPWQKSLDVHTFIFRHVDALKLVLASSPIGSKNQHLKVSLKHAPELLCCFLKMLHELLEVWGQVLEQQPVVVLLLHQTNLKPKFIETLFLPLSIYLYSYLSIYLSDVGSSSPCPGGLPR